MKRSPWLVLVGVLLLPRSADAGLLDIIWQMSGPQLLGIGIQCEVAINANNRPECILFPGIRLPRSIDSSRAGEGAYWLILETRVYASTGMDSKEDNQVVNFRVGRIRMIGADAMVARRWSARDSRTRAYSGVGVSLNHLFGSDIDQIDAYAYKFRPIGVDRRFGSVVIGAAYNIRLYPNGFEALSEPDGGLRPADRKELVHGFLVELRF